MARPFLTARWQNLIIVTYAVQKPLLASHLPAGCQLDEHPDWPGLGLVSLVAFDFVDCRVRGVKWKVPGARLVHFPEINLRFYVIGPRGRGVCFIREFVPSRLIGLVAQVVYNEPYRAAAMRSRAEQRHDALLVEHEIRSRERSHSITVEADARARPIASETEIFFKEHRWGYGRDRRGRLLVYEVVHPEWRTHEVKSLALDVDFAQLYGERWRGLNQAKPVSSMLAAGSEIEVWPCGRC